MDDPFILIFMYLKGERWNFKFILHFHIFMLLVYH